MLKNLDPILSPELLFALAAMGHGDELAIVDANFPAATMARRLVRLEAVGATRVLEAVLSLLPLDEFVDSPVAVMQVVGEPETVPEPPSTGSISTNGRAPPSPLWPPEKRGSMAMFC
jgi:L-fucose mutarotase